MLMPFGIALMISLLIAKSFKTSGATLLAAPFAKSKRIFKFDVILMFALIRST